ncbi:MAG: zinc ribbon domain-containing protein [Clostridia bacterium]|nr:zinc ribbon domain-containing protein [Clostridia bacterium]
MSFCPQCGKEIKKDASFCTQCGAKIKEPATESVQAQPQPAPTKSKAPFIIIIALLVVIVLLLGGILISKTTKSVTENNITEVETTEAISENTTTADTATTQTDTTEVVPQSSSYTNWATADNKTKLFDAGKVLETILLSCDGVEAVKVAFTTEALDSVDHDGSDFYAYAKVSINYTWMSDCGYDVMIYPMQENVIIYFGPTDAPDIPGFTYTWSGEFISGLMPLDEYIIQEGLTR